MILISGTTKDGKTVAVKLTFNNTFALKRNEVEYNAYKDIDAISGKKCKRFGICPILYAGTCVGGEVLVMQEVFTVSLAWVKENNIECSEETYFQIMLELVCI